MYRNNFLRFFAEIWPKNITSRDGCVLLIKVLSGRVRSKPCPSHQQQLRDCKCISTWEPRSCPEGSQRVSQNPCSEDASKSNPSQSQKARRVLGGLTGGFLGLVGGFRGGRAPADFFFSAGGFSAADFSMAVFWKIFRRRLNPRPAVSKFQVQHWNPPWNWNQVCLPISLCHV